MMEYVFIYFICGLIGLWLINIHIKLNWTKEELKEFRKREYEFVKDVKLQEIIHRIEKLEEKQNEKTN